MQNEAGETNNVVCSIIICNYNGKEFLNNCLNSLLLQTYKNYEVLLVDNGSTDDSINFTRINFPWVKIIQNCKNYGFAEGNNIGVKYAKGDYLIFLNNDTESDPRWLEKMVDIVQSIPLIGVVGCKVLNAYCKGIIDSFGFNCDIYGFPQAVGYREKDGKEYQDTKEVFAAAGSSLLIKRDVVEKVGCFDPEYFVLSEDLDLCWRARLSGYRVLVTPLARIYHKAAGTLDSLGRRRIRYFSERNTLRTLIKNYTGITLLKILPRYFVLLFVEILFFILTGKLHLALADIKAGLWNIKNFNDTWQQHREIQRVRVVDDATIQSQMAKRSFKIKLFKQWIRGKISV